MCNEGITALEYMAIVWMVGVLLMTVIFFKFANGFVRGSSRGE